MSQPPVSEQMQVNFRMPVDLRDRIRNAAKASNRSMNAEIVATLEQVYPAPMSADEADRYLMDLLKNLDEESQDVVLARVLKRYSGTIHELIKEGAITLPSDDD